MYYNKLLLFTLLIGTQLSCHTVIKKEINSTNPLTTLLNTQLNNKDTIAFKKTIDSAYMAIYNLDLDSANNQTAAAETLPKLIETLQHFLKIYKNNSYAITKKNKVVLFYLYVLNEVKNFAQLKKTFELYVDNEFIKQVPTIQIVNQMHNLGIAYNKLGDLQKSEQTYRQTYILASSINSITDMAKATVNLNIIRSNKKQYDTIIAYSLPQLKQDILPKYKASLALSISNAYNSTNNAPMAIKYNNMAFAYLTTIDTAQLPADFENRLANVYALQADIYTQLQQTIQADSAYTKALYYTSKYYQLKGRELAKLYIAIGNYKMLQPNSSFTQTPLYYYNKALQALQPNYNSADSLAIPNTALLIPENTYFEALDAKANYLTPIAITHNDTALLHTILEYHQISFTVEKMLLNSYVYDNSKIALMNQSRQRTSQALALCNLLYKASNNPYWATKANEFIENNKATVLLQKITENNVLQTAMLTDSIAQLYNATKQTLADYKGDNITSTANTTVQYKIDSIETQLQQYTIQLQQKYPQLNQLFEYSNKYTLAQMQKKLLNTSTTLLNYYYNDTIAYCVSITNNAIQLSATKLYINTINNYKYNCSNLTEQLNNPNTFIQLSHQLYNSLIPKGIINTNSTNLIIIPDGELNNISFDALVTQLLSTYNYAKQNYLVNNVAISYGFSIALLLQKSNNTPNTNSILAIAPACNKALNNKPTLTYTKQEVLEIKKNYPTTYALIDTAATTTNFLQYYTAYNIIHIATHSNADATNGIATIDFYDAPMTTTQFYNHNNFKASLVFLSACETTLGKQTQSEGVLNLARSIYYAGAQHIISTQWQINDEATNTIVTTFYKKIKNTPYAKALQQAKVQYITTANAEKTAPYYWAAFSQIGVTVNTSNAFNYYYLLSIVPMLFIIIIGVNKNKKIYQRNNTSIIT